MLGAPSDAIVGRDGELAAIADFVAALRKGHGGALVLEGEAGIGKSRLIAECLAMAGAASVTVLAAGAADTDRTRPFRAVADAIGARAGSGDEALAAIARMLVDTAEGIDVGHRVHEGCLAVIERTALGAPMLLCIDDLHWADPGTVSVLRSVAVSLRELPIGLVVGMRPHPRGAELQALLDSLADVAVVRRLGPLDDDAARTLVGPDGAAWNERAGGNPFFLLELARVGEAEPTELSADVRETLLRRIRQLPGDVVDMLQTASILGAGFALTDVAAVTKRPVVELVPLVAAALQAGYLVEAEAGLQFRHDLIREALAAAMPRTVAAALHREAGWALAAAGAEAVRVAPHLVAGAAAGDLEAIAWLRRAGHQAARRNLAMGIELFEAAVDLAQPRPELVAEIEIEIVGLLTWSGRFADATERGERLLRRPLSAQLEGDVRLALAEANAMAGDMDATAAHATAGLAIRELAPAVIAQLLAFRSLRPGDSAASRADIAAARELAFGPDGTPFAAAIVSVVESVSTQLERRLLQAVRVGEEAVTLVRRAAGSGESFGRGSAVLLFALQILAKSLYLADRVDEACAVVAEARTLAEGLGSAVVVSGCTYDLGLYALDGGRFDDALAEADALERLEPATSSAARLRYPVFVHTADWAAADALWELFQNDPGVDAYLPMLRARSLSARGRDDDALALLRTLWDASERGEAAWLSRTGSPLFISLLLADGDRATAADVAALAHTLAAADAVDSLRASADLCAAMLSGDVELARAAVAQVREAKEPLPVALMLAEVARLADAAGDADAAQAAMAEALGIVDDIGADPSLLGQLPRAGVPAAPKRSDRATFGWDSLTPTELRVVDAVAEGLSNPQIAQRLVVSRHTIESHVKHVFVKLGLSSRVELAAAAVRREVSAPSP